MVSGYCTEHFIWIKKVLEVSSNPYITFYEYIVALNIPDDLYVFTITVIHIYIIGVFSTHDYC